MSELKELMELYQCDEYHARALMADKVLVVFRKYSDGDIVALFPEIISDPNYHCLSYHHVGQHGSAVYSYVISITKSAKPDEYEDLKEELESIGYQLVIRKKYLRDSNRWKMEKRLK